MKKMVLSFLIFIILYSICLLARDGKILMISGPSKFLNEEVQTRPVISQNIVNKTNAYLYLATINKSAFSPHKWDLDNILLFAGEKWVDGGSSQFTYDGHKSHIVTSRNGVQKVDTYFLPTIVNMSGDQFIEVTAYCEDITKLKNMVLCLYDGSTKYAQYNFAKEMKKDNSSGWRRMRIRRKDFLCNNGFSLDNWSHLTQLKLYVTSTTGSSIFIPWASISALNIRPVITINFDDGYESVYTKAKNIMDKYKLKGIAYIIPSMIGKPDMLSITELKGLEGWDIGCHTYNHINLGASNESVIRSDLKKAGEWFKQNGFTNAMTYIAAPGGNYTNEKIPIYYEYCSAFRGNSTAGLSYSILPSYRPLEDGHWFSKYQSIYNTDSIDTVKGWIDEVIANGYHWNVTFHQITDPADISMKYTSANFDAVIAYIALKRDKGDLDVLLPSEIYK